MVLTILRLGYSVFDLVSIGAGTIVLFGLLTGELLDNWATLFLRYTLATSITGLLFSLHDFTLVPRCSMLIVYVSGLAILAWRRFHLSGIWSSIFALTIAIVLCLNVTVAIDLAFEQITWFTLLTPSQSELASRATHFIVMLLFGVFGIVAVKRFQNMPARSRRSQRIRSANSRN